MDKEIEIDAGDTLRVTVNTPGETKIVDLFVQGRVIMIQDQQTQDAMLIKPSGNTFVKN